MIAPQVYFTAVFITLNNSRNLEKYLISVRVIPFYLKQILDLPDTPWWAHCHCTSPAQILHQVRYRTKLNSPIPFAYEPHPLAEEAVEGQRSPSHLFAQMPTCYSLRTALRKDLLFWLLALSLCSGRAKPTRCYLRTSCSFKCNFCSNRKIRVLVMTAQKLKDFPTLSMITFPF